jgi:hypothetical protein
MQRVGIALAGNAPHHLGDGALRHVMNQQVDDRRILIFGEGRWEGAIHKLVCG